MMKRSFFILVSFGLMIAILAAGIGCSDEKDEKDEKKEGELPAYKIGDEWTYAQVYDGVDYTVTVEVVGTETINSEDCYVFDISYDPLLYEVYSTGKVWAAKSEPYFFAVKMQVEGTYLDMPSSQVIQASLEYPDGSPWPLEVGKEFKVTETTEHTALIAGETDTETETETTTWKVESKEDVTVSTGKFSCFVIKKYNEDGELLDTWWYSDEVENDVKNIDAITGDTGELESYSID